MKKITYLFVLCTILLSCGHQETTTAQEKKSKEESEQHKEEIKGLQEKVQKQTEQVEKLARQVQYRPVIGYGSGIFDPILRIPSPPKK